MQHCDSTCSHCARDFFSWWKSRVKSQDREAGRSGAGSFNAAAATSIRPEDDYTFPTRIVVDDATFEAMTGARYPAPTPALVALFLRDSLNKP